MKNLVIVESPAKAKTIEKFLGSDYKVMSSYGHIRDLRKKDFSIDIDNNYEPIYEVPADKSELVRKLKAAAKQAETVWLASDEDREGEAIAWHLFEVLGLKKENTRRIVFHEITKPAILNAIENPRTIDLDRVNAQQARRVLDRLVGFEISPVLWRKIKPSLSAGRVQSVAVRLICERENEIKQFVCEPFWRVNALFAKAKADLNKKFETEEEATEFLQDCMKATFQVSDINVKPVKRSPAPPFTTSTLQQEANRRLGFSVNQTMMVAQKLYEDGKITYMRTDSLNLSRLALADIAKTISSTLGDQYLHTRQYHTKSKGAQEAHEAIRPTYISVESIEGTAQERALYDLIRKRTLASQMADAQLEKTSISISISNRPERFALEGETVKFDGFLRVYQSQRLENEEETTGIAIEQGLLPHLSVGEELTPEWVTATERFTQAPPRYNEASLVKKMEDLGIGRPSTYAPTISTIQSEKRQYVERGEREGVKRNYLVLTLKNGKIKRETKTETTGNEKGRLVPTDIGMVVNDFLTQYFPDVLDYNFTAKIEEKFDEIADGKLTWQKEIDDFYVKFHPEIERINNLRMEHKVGERILGEDPASGRPVSVKIGRFGPVVQIGSAEDEEKPRFASLRSDQSISTITLEEALKLFELPRRLGEYEGHAVSAAVGRFGPYIRFDKLFVSIPKDMSPLEITLDEAIALIRQKQEAEASKLIKEFAEMPGLQVLNGRFGPYLAYKPEGARKATNYKIPKTQDPRELTFEQAKQLMEQPAPAKTRRATKKK